MQTAAHAGQQGRLRGRPLPGGLAHLHPARGAGAARAGASRWRRSRSTAPSRRRRPLGDRPGRARAHLRAAAGAPPRALLGAHLRALAGSPRAYLATLAAGAARAAAAGVRGRALAALLLRRGDPGLAPLPQPRHPPPARPPPQPGRATWRCSPSARDAGAAGPRWTWSFTMHGPTEFYDVAPLPARREGAASAGCGRLHQRLRPQPGDGLRRAESTGPSLRVVHCGVDPDRVRPAAARRRRAAGAGFRVLYVGRLVPVKGQAILLEALAALRARRDRRAADADRRRARRGRRRNGARRELGLDGEVRFAGAVGQDEIRAHYAAADVFCLPSFAEGVPGRADGGDGDGAAGRHHADHGHPRAGRRRRAAGCWSGPAAPTSWPPRSQRLARDPALRERLGRGGREKVRRRVRRARVGRQLAAISRRPGGGAAGDEAPRPSAGPTGPASSSARSASARRCCSASPRRSSPPASTGSR